MERLSSIDASFLEIEQSGPSVAVGSAMEVQGQPPSLVELKDFVAGRIESMPRFRQRVVPSRTKVRQAKWVDAEPDLDRHVRELVLEPGDSINSAVSQIMEIPMDRTAPLWDATLVRGYSENQWCFVVRLHHSIADGQGAVILLGRMIDMSPQGGVTLADAIQAMSAPPSEEHNPEEPDASGLEALASKAMRAIEKGFEGVGQFISTYPDTVRTLVAMAPRRPTELTGPVSGKRKWVGAHYSLDAIKAARKAFKGVTINDMVLASVAVGFTKLLESRGEEPTGRTLRAVMPVSLRKDLRANNQVSILPAPLPLGAMDPEKRMKAIQQATKQSKRSMLPLINDAVLKSTEKFTPAPLQEFVVSKSGVNTGYFSETLVTNVPGPMVPLFFNGQPILGNIPIIPIEGGMRIIVGITSFLSELNIGVTGDGEYAADVDVLLDGIVAGFDELCQIAAAKREKRPAAKVAAQDS